MSRLIEVVKVTLHRNGEGVIMTVEASVRGQPAYATSVITSGTYAAPSYVWTECFTECIRELDRMTLARGAPA